MEFGLHNYLGLAVHDGAGNAVGTVCVLDDSARDFTDEQRAELDGLRAEVGSGSSGRTGRRSDEAFPGRLVVAVLRRDHSGRVEAPGAVAQSVRAVDS